VSGLRSKFTPVLNLRVLYLFTVSSGKAEGAPISVVTHPAASFPEHGPTKGAVFLSPPPSCCIKDMICQENVHSLRSIFWRPAKRLVCAFANKQGERLQRRAPTFLRQKSSKSSAYSRDSRHKITAACCIDFACMKTLLLRFLKFLNNSSRPTKCLAIATELPNRLNPTLCL
jgi:hypothetical protein